MSKQAPPERIVRIGTDVVAIDRVVRLLTEIPGVVRDFMTDRELQFCLRPSPAAQIAQRFAGKEAVLKALGTGMRSGMRWHDIEILEERNGDARVALHGEVGAHARRAGLLGNGTAFSLSLAHNRRLAIALAVTATSGEVAREPGIAVPEWCPS